MNTPPTPLDERPRSGPYSGLNVNSAKRFLTQQFRKAGLSTPDLDARLLVSFVTGLSRTDLVVRGTEFLTPEMFNQICRVSERRLSGEPIDHILGTREFYGYPFKVTKDVLSPRPETEGVVDMALAVMSGQAAPHFLDLGTGSGAILLSVLAECPHAQGVGVDISGAALKVARGNAEALGVADRATFICTRWTAGLSQRFDVIVSNPPYITDAAMEALDVEVAGFDPDIALRGGADGLVAYRDILGEVSSHLKPHGVLIFEIGYDQGSAVAEMMQHSGYENIKIDKDLAGHDRVVSGMWPVN